MFLGKKAKIKMVVVITLILVIYVLQCLQVNSSTTSDYPEISQVVLSKIKHRNSFINPKSIEGHFNELILNPKFHDHDLNNKLSKDEIKHALKYALYFHYHLEEMQVLNFLKKLLEKFVDEYIEDENLNYGQFSYFCYKFNYTEVAKMIDNYKTAHNLEKPR